jgi:lipopolysaccharide/colanic/teichoic acid biosynthesis glycosyltransferase
LHRIRLRPRNPFFKAYYFAGDLRRNSKARDEAIRAFNHINEGFFTVGYLHYGDISSGQLNQMVFRATKRSLDFSLALLALVALSPILIGIALAVKLSDPSGPIIFKQKRVGKNGRQFTMYKFRSMYTDAEKRLEELRHLNETTGPVFKMKNDPRVFPLGRIIRRYSLDELPQLFNILRGEMSIVGPRPPIPKEVDQYLPWHKMRLAVKPGLTCHWQVSGRSNVTFDEWMRLDNQYVRHGNIKTDLELIGKTFKAVFKGDGAY